jgi:tetratricopeptide (TPR) repeat protein
LERVARTYESIGDIHKFARNSKEAKNAYLTAVEYHQKTQNKIGEGREIKKIGEFYMERFELEKAGKWFGKATIAVRDAKPHVSKAKVYEAQGHYFLKTEQISKALGAFQQAKTIFDKTGYPLGYDNISPMIQKLKRQQKNNAT